MEYSVNRRACGKLKIILQVDDSGNIVNEFYSTRKAANAIGHPNSYSDIAKACKNGKRLLGYYWKYEQL